MAEYDLRAFKRQLEHLSKFKGRHTELITVYVPPDYELVKIVQQLEQEHGTAVNIKSKGNRLNVMDSLTKIIVYLKQFKNVPKNGVAVFAGNIAEREGERDIELFTVVPPEPIGIKVYKCDQVFYLDPLIEMTESKEIYGLLLIERSEATVGLLKGSKIDVLHQMDSLVFGKFKAGGQSAHRFEQLRENLLKDFFKKIGEISSKYFLEKHVKGVIVGGPGPTKEEFMAGDYLDYRVKELVIGIKDIGTSGISGLHELVERSDDLLKEVAVIREKRLVQKFLEGLAKGANIAYGEQEVRDMLNKGAVETMLLSEGLDWKRVTVRCTCGYQNTITVRELEKFKQSLKDEKCPSCGNQSLSIVEIKELVEELKETAEQLNVTVEFISVDTPEGQQLLGLGGVAAFLRFTPTG